MNLEAPTIYSPLWNFSVQVEAKRPPSKEALKENSCKDPLNVRARSSPRLEFHSTLWVARAPRHEPEVCVGAAHAQLMHGATCARCVRRLRRTTACARAYPQLTRSEARVPIGLLMRELMHSLRAAKRCLRTAKELRNFGHGLAYTQT
jgi:hypothetical protein